jgi:L,D-peptidoglycan transpeptidase YkuD (ErfK/YbiS/YcfS/YnhG family)
VRGAYEHIAAASNDRWSASSCVRAVIGSKLNLYLTPGSLGGDHKTVRRLLGSLCATVCTAFVTLAAAPTGGAVGAPWFAPSVGNATQVISVVGVGGSNAKLDAYQRGAAGWQPVAAGIPAHVGSAGLAPQAKSGYPATPMGVYSLPFAFGTAPNPGGGLKYVQVDSNHWWSGDDNSPTFNTMQVCQKAQCPFDTGASENLEIPQYKHAVVMGVNPNRQPGQGAAFFFHTTDGGPTEGCVAIDDATLVQIIQWLQPGAVIAITQ